MTQAGMILGTAAYMSPEQAAGAPVDRRADIWSYGVVLWEMLSGQRLFGGETVVHTLADVLRSSIDFDKLTAPAPIKQPAPPVPGSRREDTTPRHRRGAGGYCTIPGGPEERD